jgi:hypothetical protein
MAVAPMSLVALTATCFAWSGCSVADEDQPSSIESRMSSTALHTLLLASVKSTDARVAQKYRDITNWLDEAVPEEIAGPSHVIAYAKERERSGVHQWAIVVEWVSLVPDADGVLLLADDGVAPLAFAMCDLDLADNEARTEHYIMYRASVTEWDDLGPWREFDSLVQSKSFRVLLTKDGEVVSEPCDLLVLEVEGPLPDIETESPTE